MVDIQDTIVAVASAPGPAARGIVRLSGPDAVQIASQVFSCSNGSNQADDGCDIGNVCCDANGKLNLLELQHPTELGGGINSSVGTIPVSILIWPTHRSYTRQPTVEIHSLNSTVVLSSIVQCLVESGARQANRGEFTMRAFLAGRMDLTEAEAVLGVIDSQNEKDLAVALDQLSGGLAGPLKETRDSLIDLLADIEAGLDFVEDDIEFVSNADVQETLKSAQHKLGEIKQQVAGRSVFADVPKVVLYGVTNAGKSSLFNAIVNADRAIVSDKTATTRDFLSYEMEIDGLRIELIDTAGLLECVHSQADGEEQREVDNSVHTKSEIDRRAMEHMDQQLDQAAVRILCFDSSSELSKWEKREIERTQIVENAIQVATKSDLLEDPTDQFLPKAIFASSVTDNGIQEIRDRIVSILGIESERKIVAATLTRCSGNVSAAATALSRAVDLVEFPELVSAEIRLALEQIGQMVGTVYTDDILEKIFSRFCIGK